MSKYQAEIRYIASIYPGKIAPITKFVGPSMNPRDGRATVYWMPSIKRDEKPSDKRDGKKQQNLTILKVGYQHIAVLSVADSFENVLDPLQLGTGLKTADTYKPLPVSCDELARDLISHWAGNMVGLPPGASPGIMVCANLTPTQDELSRMVLMQTAYFEHRLQEADNLANENRHRFITDEMKTAAIWLGKDRSWATPSANLGKCKWCMATMPSEAIVCQICSRDQETGSADSVTKKTKAEVKKAEVKKAESVPVAVEPDPFEDVDADQGLELTTEQGQQLSL